MVRYSAMTRERIAGAIAPWAVNAKPPDPNPNPKNLKPQTLKS
jgi:hypothetical protein